MLIAKIDELVDMTVRDVEEIRVVIEQLEPDRARSCRNAGALAEVMLDEIKLRAHAQPIISDDD
ncbi:MAG TPA: hypothetical protein VFH30_13455 [Acidimicrobiales bacterium]|nr:hypothetical protein [Acidimicrobiales bacterium]